MVEPARFTRALRDWAGDGPAARLRGRGGRGLSPLPRRPRAAGLVDAELFARRALEALLRRARAVGRRAGVRLRVRRLHPARAGGAGGAGGRTPARTWSSRFPSRSPAGRRSAPSPPCTPGSPSWRTGSRCSRPCPTTTRPARKRALHALERGLFEVPGGAVAPATPCGCTGRAASAPSWSCAGRRCCAFCATGRRRARWPLSCATRPLRVASGAGVRRIRDSVLDRPLAAAVAHRRRPRPARAAALRGPRGHRRGPARLPAHARVAGAAARWPTGWSARCAARERRTPPGRGRYGSRPTGAGGSRSWTGSAAAGGGTRLLDELGPSPGAAVRRPVQTRGARAPRRRARRRPRLQGHAGGHRRARTPSSRPTRSCALDTQRVHDTLAALPVRVGESPQPDRVQVASPLQVRARRFEAVFVCGLQETEFPRRAAPEAFLARRRPARDRGGVRHAASAARGPAGARALPVLRVRLACRAPAGAELSHQRRGGQPRSALVLRRGRLCRVRRPGGQRAHTLAGRCDLEPRRSPDRGRVGARGGARRAHACVPAAVGPRDGTPLPGLRSTRARSCRPARSRAIAGCPVKWLVEDVLRPEKLEPDPERWCGAPTRTGCSRSRSGRLRESHRLAQGHAGQPGRGRADPARGARRAPRRLPPVAQPDARPGAGAAAGVRPAALPAPRGRPATACSSPSTSSCAFGSDGSEQPAVELEDGTRVRGVIDRVDTWNEYALVRDYKSGKVDTYGEANWESERRLQAALYMLVVEQALPGLRAAGGVYVPLGGTNRTPRGLLAADLAGELGGDFSDKDFKTRAELEEHTARVRASGGRGGRPDALRSSLHPVRTPAPIAAAAPTPRSAGRRDDGLHRGAAAGDRAPRRRSAGQRRRRHGQDLRAGRALRRGPSSRTAWPWTRSWPSPSPRRPPPSWPTACASDSPISIALDRGPRGGVGLDLDDPRILRAPAARARAGGRGGPRVPRAGRGRVRAAGDRRVRPDAARLHRSRSRPRAAAADRRAHPGSAAGDGPHRLRAPAQPRIPRPGAAPAPPAPAAWRARGTDRNRRTGPAGDRRRGPGHGGVGPRGRSSAAGWSPGAWRPAPTRIPRMSGR